jgi:hypothetical protein
MVVYLAVVIGVVIDQVGVIRAEELEVAGVEEEIDSGIPLVGAITVELVIFGKYKVMKSVVVVHSELYAYVNSPSSTTPDGAVNDQCGPPLP